MKKHWFLRVLALAGALAVSTTACGGPSSAAATVDSTSIAKSDVVNELKAIIDSVGKVPTTELTDADRKDFLTFALASDGKSPSSEFAAQLLTNKVNDQLVNAAMKKYGLTVEASDTDASTTDIAGALLYKYMPTKYRDAAIAQGARTSRIARFIADTSKPWYTDADVKAYYEQTKNTTLLGEACTAHILVSDEALAADLLKQIKAGASFDAIAAANSIDESNKDTGGDLGCTTKGQFVPAFEAAVATANDGDVIGPVQTEFGFHIIKVTSTYKVLPLDDAMKAKIAESFADPATWLDYTLLNTKITVNPQFGTWDNTEHKVVAPTGAATPTTVAAATSGSTGK